MDNRRLTSRVVTVSIIVMSAAFFLFVYSFADTMMRFGSSNVRVSGHITNVDREGRTARLVTTGEVADGWLLITTDTTRITGVDGREISLDQLVPGFGVQTEGLERGEHGAVVADWIEITDQPEISILSPRPGDVVTDSALFVTGWARAFENTINYAVYAGEGTDTQPIANGFTTAQAPDIGTWGPYEFTVPLKGVTSDRITVEVFEPDARDGSQRHTRCVTVTVK